MSWTPMQETEPGHVRRLDPEQVEHVARHAAEAGDVEIESLCDDVLAGSTDSCILVDMIDCDPNVRAWMERGERDGWRAR